MSFINRFFIQRNKTNQIIGKPSFGSDSHIDFKGKNNILFVEPVLNYDNAKGYYGFESVPAGDFYIRFIYGDTDRTVLLSSDNDVNKVLNTKGMNEISYNGQDYKSTTYQTGVDQNNTSYKKVYGFTSDAYDTRNFTLPDGTLNNSTYKGATVYMKGQRDSLALLTQVTKSFNEDDVKFVLDATAQKGTLLSQLEWKDLQNDGIQGYIKFVTESGQDLSGIPITIIRFYPSTFLINDSLWDVSTSVIEIGKDRFQMKDFRIGRG